MATASESTDELGDLYRSLPIDRDRDTFLRDLLRELSSVLEDVVGLNEAEGFISLVGARIGNRMNLDYREANDGRDLSVGQVAAALVDLKRRIQGGFTIESIDDDRIVLVNTDCPFGSSVDGRESLCMMTSNVFGRIAADNLGYARVELEQTIARGDGVCRIVVHLGEGATGREYYG